MTTFAAELQRKLSGVLVDWPLTVDLEAADGVGDPVIDAGVRTRLTDVFNQLVDIVAALAGTLTVNDGHPDALTDTELRASPVPVTGSVTVDVSELEQELDDINTKLAGTLTVADGHPDPLTDSELRATPVVVDLSAHQTPVLSVPLIGNRAITGPTTLLTPSAGARLRVRRIWFKAAYDIPDGVGVEFIAMLGSTVIANDDVIASQPYADGVIKLGAVDAALTVELLDARKVFYNIAVEEIPA